eukprot:g627.t1
MKWTCSIYYVYLVVVLWIFFEFQIWVSRGNASVAEERRAELDLPAIWICPPDTESQVVIKSCIFESAGEDEECNTLKDVPYNHVGGNFNLECASISGKVNKPLVVRYDGDRLILKVLLMSRDKKEILGNRGVVAVVGRKRLWGNQWFFAPTQSLTAAQLDRTERYEYTSPLNSEVYHDYDLLVSTKHPHEAILEVLFRADSAMYVLVKMKKKSLAFDLNGGKDGRNGSKNVSLFNKRLRNDDVAAFVETLRTGAENVLEIRRLDLSYNQIGDVGATALVDLLRPSSKVVVRELLLEGNCIAAKGVAAIAEQLQHNSKLRLLNLNGNDLGRSGGSSLIRSLKSNTTLDSLSIGSTNIDANVIIELSSHMQSSCSIRHLDISNPVRKRRESDVVFQWIGKFIRWSRSLESLCLQKMDIGDSEIDILKTYLADNKTLKSLDLSRNRINAKGASVLSRLVSNGQCALTQLDVSSNQIGDKGAMAFAVTISDDATPEKLSVAHNKIGDAGLCALARALRRNSCLRELRVWGNNFGSSSADAFKMYFDKDRRRSARIDVTVQTVDDVSRIARVSIE